MPDAATLEYAQFLELRQAAGVAQMTTAGPPPDLMEFRNCKIKAPMASDYEDTFCCSWPLFPKGLAAHHGSI